MRRIAAPPQNETDGFRLLIDADARPPGRDRLTARALRGVDSADPRPPGAAGRPALQRCIDLCDAVTVVQMTTNLSIDADLIERALEVSGERTKKAGPLPTLPRKWGRVGRGRTSSG
jgi:hypothetical protein